LTLLLVFPALRAWTWWRLTGSLMGHDAELFVRHLIHPLHLHGDGVVMGLIVAQSRVLAARSPSPALAVAGRRRKLIMVGLAALAASALIAVQRELFTFTALALVCGALVTACLPASPASTPPSGRAALEWPPSRRAWFVATPVVVLARLSFGMYLNHRYVLDRTMGSLRMGRLAERFPGMHALLVFAIATLLSAAVAAVTFCLIEYPFLRVRRSLLPPLASTSGAA
jgi:peptidoglycan/LPS O-acetylase OafA/YrhL